MLTGDRNRRPIRNKVIHGWPDPYEHLVEKTS
jgi:hypothetical protein